MIMYETISTSGKTVVFDLQKIQSIYIYRSSISLHFVGATSDILLSENELDVIREILLKHNISWHISDAADKSA